MRHARTNADPERTRPGSPSPPIRLAPRKRRKTIKFKLVQYPVTPELIISGYQCGIEVRTEELAELLGTDPGAIHAEWIAQGGEARPSTEDDLERNFMWLCRRIDQFYADNPDVTPPHKLIEDDWSLHSDDDLEDAES